MSALTARVLGVALWLWLASFTFLGLDHAIGDGDEQVHATILRDMLRAGDWLAPRYQAGLVLERPLLPYWLAAPFSALVPGEVGVRLSSALASFATLVVVFVAARAAWKRADAAFVAVLLLAGSPSFHAYSRTLMSEPPLILSIAIAVGSALRMREDPRWLVGAALGLGLGIASKSLVVGVPALALLPWIAYTAVREADWRTRAQAALALAATALPYYLLLTALHGEQFLRAHFGLSLASRAQSSGGIGIGGGASAYLRWVPENEGWVTAGWLVLGSLGALLFGLWRKRGELVMLGGYALGVVALMSMLATRLPHYVLPAYPAAALGVAGLCAQVSGDLGLPRRAFGLLAGPMLAMVVLLAARAHPGDAYLLQRPWGRELGAIARRVVPREETLYIHEWKGTSLRYYSERRVMLLTEDPRRFDVVKGFVATIQLVPPAPAPPGSLIYVAGEAAALDRASWMKVEQALGASTPPNMPSMFLVRARITEPAPPARTTPAAAPP